MGGAWRASVGGSDVIGVELLGDVADAALEGHLALGRVFGHDVALRADDVQDQVLSIAPTRLVTQLAQPHAHLFKALLARDVVA